MDKHIQVLLLEIAKLKAENKELTKTISAIGAIQFLIFRFLMQYDKKLASEISKGISKELDKPAPPNWQGDQYYKDHMKILADIALNPEQRDEKGRPSWIHVVKD